MSLKWKEDYIKNLLNPYKWNNNLVLKRQNLPSTLFKYRTFDETNSMIYSIEAIKENKIWLSSPDNLNDPYDCSFDINSDDLSAIVGPSLNDIEAKIKDALKELEAQGKQDFIDWFRRVIGKRDEDLLLEFNGSTKKNYHKIFSLSERKDSILMWTHYAKNHTGFCVEYETPTDLWDGLLLRCIHPVIYTDKLPNIGKYIFSQDPWEKLIGFILPALHKAKDWEYEKEWRFILSYGILSGNKYISPPIRAVYAGARISEADLAKLKSLCIANSISLFRTSWKARQFEMSIQ
ncbi:MAG TPA: DUF2971 domain-containing protein [Arachidicoccus sp.]|nr:DUF2971 domain-containing protein [Arachidicoccus sp.]